MKHIRYALAAIAATTIAGCVVKTYDSPPPAQPAATAEPAPVPATTETAAPTATETATAAPEPTSNIPITTGPGCPKGNCELTCGSNKHCQDTCDGGNCRYV